MLTPNGDVVVVLPGILGSRLRRWGRETWGFGQFVRSIGQFSRRLTENLSLGPRAYSDQENGDTDGTVVDGIMSSGLTFPPRRLAHGLPARLAAAIPGFWTLLDGYDLLLARLENAFDPLDVIAFPYDWRQSNRVSAKRMQRFVEPLIRERRRTHPSARLILVGHSMGGLVARYYAECLDKNRFTARVITIGTPYQGAVKALLAIANGSVRLSAGPLAVTVDIGELVRTLPSVAELLPTYACVGANLDSLGEIGAEVTVPGLPQSIRDHAAEFHREIATAVAANGADRPLYSPILGHRQLTVYWASVGESGLQGHSPVEMHLRGDGKVPRASAIPPEWQDRSAGAFVNGRHASLQHNTGAWEQILGILTSSAPRRTMAEVEELIVDAPEYVAPGEEWTVTAKALSGSESLALIVEVSEDGRVVERRPLRLGDAGYSATLNITSPGMKRWQVSPDPMSNTIADSISDVLVCADP